MNSEIRDISLAESGERKIEWVKRNCDLLRTLETEFAQSKPLQAKKSLCLSTWKPRPLIFVLY